MTNTLKNDKPNCNQEIASYIKRFAIETVANVLDTLELGGVSEKMCAAVKRGIYGRRDAFLLELGTGAKSNERIN
ncbi:MAG: hypothetical protein A2X47_10920 [Lentisphaerae bacterium GWF2_38_69]|nr:MAG: hypothetical protein A2X47_10920 [Lentisphaerae bacterium GWF2_38_69]